MARQDPEHVQAIIDEGKFNRRPVGTDDLRAACKTGYIFTTTSSDTGEIIAARQSDFHHILPIEVMGDDSIVPDKNQAKLDFFHNCMAVTKWDINEEHNLIGLPTRKVYESAERSGSTAADTAASPWVSNLRNIAARLAMFGSLPDLPCHEIDHNPEYNQGVKDYMKMQVWDPLSTKQPNCEIDPKDFRQQLVNAAKHWRQFLVDRGGQHQGASHCWVKRNEPGYDQFWYVPFSMNPGRPRPVPPPPPLGQRAGTVKEWLRTMIP